MGAIPTKPADAVPLAMASTLVAQPGTRVTIPHMSFFTRYVAQCNAHRGVVLVRYAADGFDKAIASEGPKLHEAFLRHGVKSAVRSSIYYEVLESEADEKSFTQHMKGLESIAFLSLPSVVTPRTGLIFDRGVTIACSTIHHLHTPVPMEQCTSTHVVTTRITLSKVLRLRGDPCALMYEGGDGTLVVVDASSLLPTLCITPSSAKRHHCARPELLMGRDCSWAPVPAAVPAVTHLDASSVSSGLPHLHSVVASATMASVKGSKRTLPPLQYLHAVLAVGNGSQCLSLDSSVKTVTATSRSAACAQLSATVANVFDGDQITRFALGPLLKSTAERVETTAPDDLNVTSLMHQSGLGMHMVGALWSAVGVTQVAPQNKQKVAVEIIARSAKTWLRRQQRRTAEGASDAVALELFRCVFEDAFLQRELLPIAVEKYGRIEPAITSSHLPFRWTTVRLSELTGYAISKGIVTGTSPRIRVAMHHFNLSAADELAIASVAVKRDDPMGVAAVLSAAGYHARSANRIAGVIQQLRSRRLDNAVLLMFVGLLELHVVDTLIATKNMQAAVEWMESAVPAIFSSYNQAHSHDRLFATRHGLRLVNFLQRVDRFAASHTYMKQLLEVGAMRELHSVGLVPARQMLEEYHKSAVDGFSHSREEALLVAQAWTKLCPLLFGPLSVQNCKATKMLLVCLVKCRKHADALAAANEYMSLAMRAFGSGDVYTAMAMNDVATLTWRRNPRRGLALYQKALEVFRRSPAGKLQVPSTLYNMALASMRINKLRQALGHLALSREAAISVSDRPATEMCDRMKRAVFDIAATKIQRWVRDCMYGIAPSQTSRTDLCSTISWSDKDDVASTAGDIMHATAVLQAAPSRTVAVEQDHDADFTE